MQRNQLNIMPSKNYDTILNKLTQDISDIKRDVAVMIERFSNFITSNEGIAQQLDEKICSIETRINAKINDLEKRQRMSERIIYGLLGAAVLIDILLRMPK
jgi:hypothetical protein